MGVFYFKQLKFGTTVYSKIVAESEHFEKKHNILQKSMSYSLKSFCWIHSFYFPMVA